MLSPTQLIERAPMVWFLLGLLFFSGGLYLGFEYVMSFWYMMIGAFCCAFGVALFVFRLQERPKSTKDTRLSPNFIQNSAYASPTPNGDVSAAGPAPEKTENPAGNEQPA